MATMMVIAGSRSNESSWKACCNVLRCKSMACPEATCKRVTTGQPAHLEHSHGRVRDDDARPVGERVVGLRVSRRLKPARARLAQPPSQAHGRTEAWQCTVHRMRCRADRSTARAWQAHGHAGQCRTPRPALAYSAASPSAAAPLTATRAVQGATVRHALRLTGAGHSREVAAARTRKGAVHHGPRPARQHSVSATSGAVTGGCGRQGAGSAAAARARTDRAPTNSVKRMPTTAIIATRLQVQDRTQDRQGWQAAPPGCQPRYTRPPLHFAAVRQRHAASRSLSCLSPTASARLSPHSDTQQALVYIALLSVCSFGGQCAFIETAVQCKQGDS